MRMLKRIQLTGGNTNDAIVPYEAQYLVKVQGRWRAGTFAREWFGLKFTDYGADGIALEVIDEVYEIAPDAVDATAALPVAYLQDE